MAKPVEVMIMGQTFSVTSDDGEEHVRQVATLVDRTMREIAGGGKVVSSFTAAVLAALNIASECQKLRQDVAQIQATIDRLTQRLGVASGEPASGEPASGQPAGGGAKERTIRNG
jgi:cell division protein ZapA (FtsZ GTPase activity inhibitor)